MTRLMCILFAAALLGGCTGTYVGGGISANNAINVRGHLPDLRFHLTDDQGRAVSENTFRGRTTLVYFGYTGCGAECPVTLARLAAFGRRVSPAPQVLFVSVTPDLDSPAVMHAYLARFDPAHMTGLTGNAAAARLLARDLRAAWPQPGGGGHGNLVYVFDAQGHASFLITPEATDSEAVRTIETVGHG